MRMHVIKTQEFVYRPSRRAASASARASATRISAAARATSAWSERSADRETTPATRLSPSQSAGKKNVHSSGASATETGMPSRRQRSPIIWFTARSSVAAITRPNPCSSPGAYGRCRTSSASADIDVAAFGSTTTTVAPNRRRARTRRMPTVPAPTTKHRLPCKSMNSGNRDGTAALSPRDERRCAPTSTSGARRIWSTASRRIPASSPNPRSSTSTA